MLLEVKCGRNWKMILDWPRSRGEQNLRFKYPAGATQNGGGGEASGTEHRYLGGEWDTVKWSVNKVQ